MTTVDPLTDDLARTIDGFLWNAGINGPHVAAMAVLGRPAIVEALRSQATVDALRIRHAPVPVAGGETRLVCAATRKHPESCEDCRVLWGTEG